MGGASDVHETEEKGRQVSSGKPEGRRSFGRHRHRWKDNTNVDINRRRKDRRRLDSSGQWKRPPEGSHDGGSECLSSIKWRI